ncbi:MAG TPA: SRPBCC domain-containing protein [Phenylobacterium sp.]|jgi:uncharacterized protein YndB with AHSA1/START domain|nr:SRPBCC domain-containing protein [Phenylobacterium sp.]
MIEDIEAGIDISAPVERVWTVLTGEGLVEQWLGCLGFKPIIGHVFYMQQDNAKRTRGDVSGAIHCAVEALEPPNRFVFSWYYPQMPKTRVTLALTATTTGTRVSLVHTGWDQYPEDQIRAVRDGLSGGWTSFVLPMLKRVAEA